MKITAPKIAAKKKSGEKIAMLTCYDATFAQILDQAGIDILLVGDSLGMVIQGEANTLPVTMEDIVYHTRCVTSKTKEALVVADLPFMSYQPSIETALNNAGRCLKEAKAEAVKLEGGKEFAETVYQMTRAGIPVMGHIGLKPQSIHQMGGYKIQGKTETAIQELLKDALALEEAGVFSIVLEGVTPEAAKQITQAVAVPTIGIASGPDCDGQVLVLYDLLGLNPSGQPAFAKKYLDGHGLVTHAVKEFIDDSKNSKRNARVVLLAT